MRGKQVILATNFPDCCDFRNQVMTDVMPKHPNISIPWD